jgi:hypothetical protein
LTNSRFSNPSGGGDMDPAKKLAALFGAPAPQLKRRILRTLGELDASEPATRTHPPEPSDKSANLDPPALRRMIVFTDDPNKGRFGGRRLRGGFKLRAEFKPTSNKNWIRITLTVATSREVSKGAVVEYFLHDSFRPSRVKAAFRNGTAKQVVTSWGGFTVGAWIPSEKVELELDLARQPGAPKIIRER